MSSNSKVQEQVIPSEILRYSYGSVHQDSLDQIFGVLAFAAITDPHDSRRRKIELLVNESRFALLREFQFDWYLQQGFDAGLGFVEMIFNRMDFDSAVSTLKDIIENRLSVIAHIEAVFFTHRFEQANDRKRISQSGIEISDSESFVFAAREALRYGLTLAVPDDFVEKELPRVPVKFINRFWARDAKIVETGIMRAKDFIRDISMTEVWLRSEQELYNPISDPAENRYKRILVRKDLQVLFVKALRSNKQLFHLFRLGFGFPQCRPSLGNLIFALDVPAENVPACHIAEVFHNVQNPGQSHELWWMQNYTGDDRRRLTPAERPFGSTIG